MDLYTQIYNILIGESNPKDKSNELTILLNTINKIKSKINRSTSSYYGQQITNLENKKFLIMDEISSYNFYLKNKNSNNNFDLHEMYGYQINSVLDAIFDYCILKEIKSFHIITGNGNVIKPKVIKYLKYFNVSFKFINNGLLNVNKY